jgi:hypothetical protein
MLQDIDAAISQDFIERVAPAAAARLRTWPPLEIINDSGARTLQLAYGVDPMALLNSTLNNIQVSPRLMLFMSFYFSSPSLQFPCRYHSCKK